MAGNIKGITIEIGADASKVDKSLKEINSASRKINKELNAVNKSLKFNPKNTELLKQKQEQLGKAIKNSKDKLAELKTAQEAALKAFEKGEIGKEKYDQLTREILKTENQLERFENQLGSLNDKWKQVGETMTETGNKMATVGDKLTKGLTVPMAAAGAAIVGAAKKSGEAADRLLDLSDITGMTTDAIQEWQHVAVDAGVSTESMTGAVEGLVRKIPQLEKEGGKATDALNKLGVTYAELKNQSPDEQVNTLMTALASMEDPLERNAAASALFGGAWKDIAPMLGMGAEGIAEAKKEAHELGVVLDRDSLEAANNFRKSLDKLKEVLDKAVNKIGAEFAPILEEKLVPLIEEKIVPAIEKFVKNTRNMIEIFEKLPRPIKAALGVLAGALFVIGPLLSAGGRMIKGIGFLIEGLSKTGPIAKVLTKVMGKLGPVFGLVKEAVVGLVTALGPTGLAIVAIGAAAAVAAVLIIKNWDKISEATEKFVTDVKDTITEKWNDIKESTKEFIETHKEVFKQGWEDLKTDLAEKWESIKGITAEKTSSLKESVTEVFNGIKETVSTTWDALKENTAEKLDAIKTTISDNWEGLKTNASETFSNISEDISTKWTDIKDKTKTTWDEVSTNLKTNWDNLKTDAGQKFDNLKSVIVASFNQLKTNTKSAWVEIKSTIAEKVKSIEKESKVFEKFSNAINKTWDSIKSATRDKWESIKESIVGPLKSAVKSVKDFIDKVKSIFKTEIKFPKIKLPKFDIKGKFSLNPPEVPNINVSWHRKGGIFTKPTIFATPGGYHGVGEAGAEAVLPVEKLKDMIKDVVKGQGDTYIFNVKFDEISELEEFIKMAKAKKRIAKQGDIYA